MKKVGHTSRFISVWHLLMNLKSNYLLKNLSKWAKNHNHNYEIRFLRYGVRQTIFVIFGHSSLLVSPHINPQNHNFEKMKQTPGDVIILHMCTKSQDHIMHASWDMECDRHFFSFWVIFCPFTPLTTLNTKIWKSVKSTWRYYPFTHVCHKSRSNDGWLLRYKAQRTEFFVILGHFLPFDPPNNPKKFKFWKKKAWRYYHSTLVYHKWQVMYASWDLECETLFCHFDDPKNQNLEKLKKTPGDIILFHMCTINQDQMMDGSWDIKREGQSFLSTRKIQILKKWKKRLKILSFYMCTINENHMTCGSWDMEWDRQNVFVILSLFLLFYSTNNPKNKNFKWKKCLKISSFYTGVP